MKIAIGADHFGYNLKELIKKHLLDLGHEPVDYGCTRCEEIDYPDVAFQVAEDIRANKFSRGILICGTGLGVCIAACKVPGIRAAVCHDTYSAERARKSNNAQILTMGAKVIGEEVAKKVVNAWLSADFAGGRSLRKVEKINKREQEFQSVARSEAHEKTDK